MFPSLPTISDWLSELVSTLLLILIDGGRGKRDMLLLDWWVEQRASLQADIQQWEQYVNQLEYYGYTEDWVFLLEVHLHLRRLRRQLQELEGEP